MPNSILSEFLHAFFLSLQIIVEMVPTLEPKLGNCIYSLCHIWLVCFLFILKIPFHLIASSECWYSLDHFEIDALCLLEIFRIVVMKLVQAHECSHKLIFPLRRSYGLALGPSSYMPCEMDSMALTATAKAG